MRKQNNKFKTLDILESDNMALTFLYEHFGGRLLLKWIIHPITSRIGGRILNSRLSRFYIPFFVKHNDIDMGRYAHKKYRSFNQFFTRPLKENYKVISDNPIHLAAPCDGKLTAFSINNNICFKIKDSEYTIASLLKDQKTAKLFADGICLIFRLTPDDYHRYYFIDNGSIIAQKKIKGVLHTVRPIVLKNYKVYHENSREWTLVQTENFGKVVQIEVGALLVGKINNRAITGPIVRGEEKGMFEFGGSTIILLFQKDTLRIDDAIWNNTADNKETIICCGEIIGKKL